MRIEKICIQNLRAARDLEVVLDDLTALVGANGSGKSTVLHALLVFFRERSVTAEDYYGRDTGEDITIKVTFSDLGAPAQAQFSKYVKNGRLEVTCIVNWDGGKATSTLHGFVLQNPDFTGLHGEPKAGIARPIYEALTAKPEYGDLPKAWPGIPKLEGVLAGWEEAHPEKCTLLPDGGQFFGYSGVGYGYLKRHVRLLYVPAVRDAVEYGREGRGSVLGALLDLTVRKALAGRSEYKALPDKVQEAYDEAMGAENLPELGVLKDGLSKTLGRFAGGAEVDLEWRVPPPNIGEPGAAARLVEDGYSSPIDGAGHGLQRAFIMAALHHLSGVEADAAAKPDASDDDADNEPPSLVLAIEEPELYQHPTRMRHLANLLRSMPSGGLDGVADSIQVVYTTHSPHFVFADRIDQIRLVSKKGGKEDMPRAATVKSTTSTDILTDLKRIGAASAADDVIDYSLLRAIGPAASEGFFADVVVLTEGPSDRIALLGAAEIMGQSLDALGVSVISCESKTSMPLPIAMFRRLGIPVYAVWDADKDVGTQRGESEHILSALGHGDGAKWRGKVNSSFACLATNLEATINGDLKKVLGPDAGERPYDDILARRRALHGLGGSGSKPLKTRLVMEEAKDKELHLETLESIVKQIVRLVRGDPA